MDSVSNLLNSYQLLLYLQTSFPFFFAKSKWMCCWFLTIKHVLLLRNSCTSHFLSPHPQLVEPPPCFQEKSHTQRKKENSCLVRKHCTSLNQILSLLRWFNSSGFILATKHIWNQSVSYKKKICWEYRKEFRFIHAQEPHFNGVYDMAHWPILQNTAMNNNKNKAHHTSHN